MATDYPELELGVSAPAVRVLSPPLLSSGLMIPCLLQTLISWIGIWLEKNKQMEGGCWKRTAE